MQLPWKPVPMWIESWFLGIISIHPLCLSFFWPCFSTISAFLISLLSPLLTYFPLSEPPSPIKVWTFSITAIFSILFFFFSSSSSYTIFILSLLTRLTLCCSCWFFLLHYFCHFIWLSLFGFPFHLNPFFCFLASFLSATLYHPLSCSLSSSCSTYHCISVLTRSASPSVLPLS